MHLISIFQGREFFQFGDDALLFGEGWKAVGYPCHHLIIKQPYRCHYTMIVGVLPFGARRPGKRSVFLTIIPYFSETHKYKKPCAAHPYVL